ncbi:hypothetical protein AMTRI_Chr08g161360 [Amborella trichopoda]
MAGGQSLLAACGGDTVKLFNVSTEPGDPCTLHYSPSPGFQVNSAKWNHTNLVVASAGDDKKISLWQKNGQSLGTVPPSGTDVGDKIDESILAISFSNKGSRYLCSGGTGQVVRIWDLQRKRCIKWLKGHTDTITGVMYNCKDEHLASISLKGDLILHNLASGAQAAELKDPNQQVLRVLDYSRTSRHVLVTAGDDGSVHLWDTTGRSPKISWLKQHSAPIAGVCFSPQNDKIIASVGLDKKLYTYDTGSKRATYCIPYEAPFSSLAFKEEDWLLAAGTNSGRVVFYDVRGKPQPFTVLRAYGNSEAVTSLCWQRSKPIVVNENNCTTEAALLGGAGDDSILMPDPLPSMTSSAPSSTVVSSLRSSGRVPSMSDASFTTTSIGLPTNTSFLSTPEETPTRNHLLTTGSLAKLQAARSSYNFKDDMEVFSPLVDVQPITPSLGNWDDHDDLKKDHTLVDKRPGLLFPSSIRRFPHLKDGNSDSHPISDWKSTLSSRQDDSQTSSLASSTPVTSTSSRSDRSFSANPPEAWGDDIVADKLTRHRQLIGMSSRLMTSSQSSSGATVPSSVLGGLHDSSISVGLTSASYLSSTSLSAPQLQGKDITGHEIPSLLADSSSNLNSTLSTSIGFKSMQGPSNLEVPGSVPVNLARKYTTYAERISNSASFGDGAAIVSGSPKLKKTGVETREELMNASLLRSDTSAPASSGIPPVANGPLSHSQKGLGLGQHEHQQLGTPSFALQLVQRTLEETLSSVQKSIHDDVRNLHIELLRQFHMHEMEMSSLLNSVLVKQEEMMKEIQALRKENQQLRQTLL